MRMEKMSRKASAISARQNRLEKMPEKKFMVGPLAGSAG
jgi:hypothetical protein